MIFEDKNLLILLRFSVFLVFFVTDILYSGSFVSGKYILLQSEKLSNIFKIIDISC